eukprot:3660246-Pyramimonas_sp.AAC.1
MLLCSALANMHHQFIRQQAVAFSYVALHVTQISGRPGCSAEFAVLCIRQHWHATRVQKVSAGGAFIDILAAFYSPAKQLALRLPRDGDTPSTPYKPWSSALSWFR